MAQVRAKFKVTKVSKVDWNPSLVIVELTAVGQGSEEDTSFHRYTPSGSITLTIDNPPAAAVFELGKTFYTDFTPVE